MKKVLFIILVLIFKFSSSQTIPGSTILNDTSYRGKKLDSLALISAKYLLSRPFDSFKSNCVNATVIVWYWYSMSDNPDLVEIDMIKDSLGDGHMDAKVIFASALVEYASQNKSSPTNKVDLRSNTYKTLLNFYKDEENGLKRSKYLDKLLEIESTGKLEEELLK